jgi:hypothetical protein
MLAYQGVTAPHTGKPISEALLLGISGGIVVGYFTFEYEGYLPHVALLIRNTFDPLETLFDRLALPREVLHTTKAEKAEEKLVEVLESGRPAMVWADIAGLPYTLLQPSDVGWMMIPIVVYGVESDRVYIADRSHKPFTISREQLMKARGRIKEDKFRIMTVDAPDMEKLPSAVQKGIWQCISLYTDAPPKGARDNFGFAALQFWANMLTNTRNKRSWERFFPAGSKMFGALAGDLWQAGIFGWICTMGIGEGAERGVYADFLDEAAVILNKPALKDVAQQFRAACGAWCELANATLPENVAAFKETADLKLRKHHLYVHKGQEALDEIRAINTRLLEIKAQMADSFPLSASEAATMRENMREHVLKIHDIELQAVTALQTAMA